MNLQILGLYTNRINLETPFLLLFKWFATKLSNLNRRDARGFLKKIVVNSHGSNSDIVFDISTPLKILYRYPLVGQLTRADSSRQRWQRPPSAPAR